jgi:hypothetical protein
MRNKIVFLVIRRRDDGVSGVVGGFYAARYR